MRISDWSSDVCSSDLGPFPTPAAAGGEPGLELAGDLFDLVALDLVADLDVGVVLEGHAALVAVLHFAHLVLEAPERLQGAVVDDDVVAQQADLRSALH